MQVNKILFITLSNIGDVILTLPALDLLKAEFPQAKITVMVGPRPKSVFENSPCVDSLIIYDKYAKLRKKISLFKELKREKFDLVVDLRNTFFGVFLPARYKTPFFLRIPRSVRHMKDRHLYRAFSFKPLALSKDRSKGKSSIHIGPRDEESIEKIYQENNIKKHERIALIAPGARSDIKRWPADKFIGLIQLLNEKLNLKVVLVGDKDDVPVCRYITENLKHSVIDLSGKTSISELAVLLKRSQVLISNDSAVLHLASYLNIPIVAIFGPTDEVKYGPWPDKYVIVKKDIFCRPCNKALCKFKTQECMQLIKVEDVARAADAILMDTAELCVKHPENFKRILIVRTDRIGDVILSTPVIKELRENYPDAYIAMMVSPYTKDIVEANPGLDEAIIYDKEVLHKGWLESIRFSQELKNKKFDLAIILHPSNRVHIVTFLAAIPKRIGYIKDMGFLLTDGIKHTKQFGLKHESEYNLDLVRRLGIKVKNRDLFMPIKEESERWVDDLFKREGIKENDPLLIINPAASCPSRIWPYERFAEVADKLVEKCGFKVLVIGGPKETLAAGNVIKYMRKTAIDVAGKTSISQLASLLKRGRLLISNDSGPVHIASALGIPVVSIFSRSQKGLSPTRWGPLGKFDKVLHKDVGCVGCLAHNCVKGFACLKAITVDDVLKAAEDILEN